MEIDDITLIGKSMSEIGHGVRTNGYGGFGEALKGNFRLSDYGEVLLFVQSRSAPTIHITRKNAKDVFISFRDGERTTALYQELKAALP
jgi:hypothetical protein